MIMFQNTRPTAFQSPHAKNICIPNMVNMNITMNRRKDFVRTNGGIGLCGENLASRRSYMLPRGQAFPHHHLPRLIANATGATMHISASRPMTG